jgi:phosphoribosylamine--glycine ligase
VRFLGIGEYCDLGDLYLRLAREGHEVRVHIGAPESRETLSGLIERTADWRAELPWIRSAGRDGILLFERADAGAEQDALRADGYNVIGGSAFGDRLEADRAFGQKALRDAGVATAPVYAFRDFDAGIAHLRSAPGRYVYKPNGFLSMSLDSYVGQLDDGSDVIDVLEAQRAAWQAEHTPDFVLMPFLDGVEVGVGAYFNGERFLEPACIDLEHKRFFPGDLGELTGEMGTVVSYRGAERLFAATLGRLAGPLAASGYVGYINLNTIVDGSGIWPLEFTSRFGYPGYSILDPLQVESWGALFARLCDRSAARLATRDGYAVGVVLTVPPFPYLGTVPASPQGLRVLFRTPLTPEEADRLHYSEVALRDGQLVTAGAIGQVMVVTGCGATVAEAREHAYGLARKVAVPNLRYRTDIGQAFIERDEARLKGWRVLR